MGVVCAACFAAGLGLVVLTGPSRIQTRPDPKIGNDRPLANAMFRFQRRLDPDGTVPENAWMKAKAALDEKKRASLGLRAGITPMSWTFLGPMNVGGRIRAIVIHPTTPTTMWIGSTSGGIWKTTNGGTTWTPMDDFLPGLAVGCMAIDPSNPNILYAGTGEGFFETEEGTTNTACIRGAGIFKSTDGGLNWNQSGQTNSQDFYFVNRLALMPGSPSTLLAATSTGIWRSTNGGNTWTKTLANEWVYDVDFDPTDPNEVIAGVHMNGVYRSLDAGQTWIHSPSIVGHRTEVSYAPSSPNVVYASVGEAGSIRIWTSADGGATFALKAASAISTYEAYNNALWVNPVNPNNIIYGGVYLYRSTDGGATRSGQVFSNVHADIHAFVTHPQYDGSTNKIVYVGTDGGLYRINDPAGTNTNVAFIGNMGITQFYGASMNPVSGRVMGGTQDNGTRLYTGTTTWTQSAGGDGGYTATDPLDQNYFYGTIYYALHFRSTNGGTSTAYIYNTANPIQDADNDLRCNFENYLALDPNNANRMLVCTERLWRSNNVKAAAPDWFIIKQSIAPPRRGGGGGVGGGNAHFASNPPYNISTVTVAKGNSDVIWVGHNNGDLYKSTDGTATNPTWTRVDTNGPLPDRWVSRICIDPTNASHVYVSFLGWHDDSVWETTDGGLSWTDIASGRLIPASVNALAIHPTKPGWLYAGTDLGLFTSSDNGASWSPNSDGPGAVSIEEITWKDATTLVLSTYGRGVFSAVADPAVDQFVPYAFSIAAGLSPFGVLTDVYLSDDRRITATPDYSLDRSRSPVEFDFDCTSPIASPSALSLTLEAAATAGGAARISLWSFSSSSWVSVDLRSIVTTDTTYTVAAPAPLGRFVGPNRQIRVRVGIANPTGPRAWVGSVDRIYGRVSP